MRVYIDDITEDYGDHGVAVYSLVQGMSFYYAEVRASGISLYDPDGFVSGKELDAGDPKYEELVQAINNYIKENINE